MYISGGGLYRKPGAVAWREKLKQDRAKRISRFAELLAEGYSVTEAAVALGVTQQAGSLMLKTMREDLGWQAQ